MKCVMDHEGNITGRNESYRHNLMAKNIQK